jgi:uncharacterized protein YacL (UPF0231 family)
VSSKTDQCRKLKEMQYTFNELEYIAQIFFKHDFLSRSKKYRLKEETEAQRKKEEAIKRTEYEVMFHNIFMPKLEVPKPRNNTPMSVILDAKYGRPKGKKQTIEIGDHDDEDDSAFYKKYEGSGGPFAYQERTQRRSYFDPINHINVGKYFYMRLKQYMVDNEAAASRFNAIHSVIGSWSYYNLLSNLSKIMQELLRVFNNIIEDPQARRTNRRALAMALWTNSQIVLRYSGNWQKAEELLEEVYLSDSDELALTEVLGPGKGHSIFPVS